MKKSITLLILPLFFVFPLISFASTPPSYIVCTGTEEGYTTQNWIYNLTDYIEGGGYAYRSLDNGSYSFHWNGSYYAESVSRSTNCTGRNIFGIGGVFSKTTTSDLLASIGEVSSPVFNAVFPYLMLSGGVFVAFYIVQKLIMMLAFERSKKKKK